MKDVHKGDYKSDIDFGGNKCSGDFDGERLHFLNEKRPYQRCLTLHAVVSLEQAIDCSWIQEDELEDLNDEDMWSKQFIEKWLADIHSARF